MFDRMTEDNYLFTAMKAYDNMGCHSLDEFREDLNRTKYIKRLLNRYVRTGRIKERLILNHLIIFCNTFGNEHAIRMLFFKLDKKLYSPLKTFLTFLNIMPERIIGVSDRPIYDSDIIVDNKIADILRSI